MMPVIEDLNWHDRGVSPDNFVTLRWTDPAWLMDARMPLTRGTHQLDCQAVTVVDYDIRFTRFPQLRTEADFDNAQRLRFRSKGLVSHDESAWGASLSHNTIGDVCFLHLSFFPGYADYTPPADMRSQRQERTSGYYSLRYCDATTGWSSMSNVLYDDIQGRSRNMHQFEIRFLGSGGVSAGPVSAGMTYCEIRDPYANEKSRFRVSLAGLSVGARVGIAAGSEWMKFGTRKHVHLKDFDGMGLNLYSQGIGIGNGIGRMSVTIYDTAKGASVQDEDALVAGPVNYPWSLGESIELNLLSRMFGKLVRTDGL